jgi:hypothetical protein
MQPSSHIDDDALSAFADHELGPDEIVRASAHLETCSDCQERLDGLRSVAVLLRQLPEVEPPRDFALGPTLVMDPPNVVRLQRWYTAARASAAALAAVCVFLLAGTLYLDTKPAPTAARPESLAAPAVAPATSAPPAVAAPRAVTPQSAQAVPAAALAPAAAAADQSTIGQARSAAGDAAPHPTAISAQSDDQVAAATSVSPLPTPPPTPVPTAVPAPVAAVVATAETGPGAAFVLGALAAGMLAVVALLIALVARHRLQRTSTA